MSKKLRSKDLISLKDNFHKFETCYKDIKIDLTTSVKKVIKMLQKGLAKN